MATLWAALSIISFSACQKDPLPVPGDRRTGATIIYNPVYGDSITTINGDVITYNGDVWQMWDSSTNTWVSVIMIDNSTTITVGSGGTFVNGNQINIGQIVYDHSTNTTYEWNGSYWIGDDNRSYYWDQSTHSFVQVIHNGDIVTFGDNGVYINGDLVNNNQVYDSSTNTVYTYNVQGDFWLGDNQFWTFNTTNNTWVKIDIVQNYTECCPTCDADTVTQIITVIDTIHTTSVDTFYVQDTIVQIIPDGHKALALKRLEDSWMVKNLCMSALEFLSGGPDTLRAALRWGPSPTFGNFELLGGPANGVYQYRSKSLHANQTANFTMSDVTSGNLPLSTTGISDCAQSQGAMQNNPDGVYNQSVGLSLVGTPPSAWVGGNYQLKFQAGPWNSTNYVVFTQEVRNMINVMGGLSPTIDGWILVKETRPNGQPAKYLNFAKTNQGQYDDVSGYVYPN